MGNLNIINMSILHKLIYRCNGKIKINDNTKCWWGCSETGTYIASDNVKQYNHSEKQFGSVLKTNKQKTKQKAYNYQMT